MLRGATPLMVVSLPAPLLPSLLQQGSACLLARLTFHPQHLGPGGEKSDTVWGMHGQGKVLSCLEPCKPQGLTPGLWRLLFGVSEEG